jgi:hypothetical protein
MGSCYDMIDIWPPVQVTRYPLMACVVHDNAAHGKCGIRATIICMKWMFGLFLRVSVLRDYWLGRGINFNDFKLQARSG